MRLLLITGIFPPDIGGPATYVPQLARSLAQRGHQIMVLTLSERLDHDDSHYPFRVARLPRHLHKPLRWLRTIYLILRLGRQVDVLFANGLVFEAVLANCWLRMPLVQKVGGDLAWEQASGRGWVTDSFESFQQRRYRLIVEALKRLRTWWTRQADCLIVPSHYRGKVSSVHDWWGDEDFSALWGSECRDVGSGGLYRNLPGNLHHCDLGTAARPSRLWTGGDYSRLSFAPPITSQL